METIICDTSAFLYWRTPPIVRLLAAAPEDNSLLDSLISKQRLHELRDALVQSTPLGQLCLSAGPHWRRSATRSRTIRDASMLLAPSLNAPVDIMVRSTSEQSRTELLTPRVVSADVPFGATVSLMDELSVASPALALQQLAARTTVGRALLLASELCGTFSTYRAPSALARELQRLVDEDRFPRLGGWRPCLGKNRRLGDLWSHDALVAPEELAAFARETSWSRGREKLSKVASLVVPGAASPLEVRTGVFLGLSRRRGGEGHAGFSYNKRIALSPDAAALAQRNYCLCDLYYEEGIDVECQGEAFHNSEKNWLSDSERATGLGLMHITVVPVTSDIISRSGRMDALSRMLSHLRNRPYLPKTEREQEATRALRRDVFSDWLSLPYV